MSGSTTEQVPTTSVAPASSAAPDTASASINYNYEPQQSNYTYGLDIHAASNGDPGILDTVTNLATKAAPLTALSIINSYANTGIAVGNFFGGDFKPLDVHSELDAIGADQATSDYYDAHKQGIEAAGLLIGSLAPGLGGIKLASLAGRAAFGGVSAAAIAADELASTGSLTATLSRATGILAGPKQALIQGAYDEIMAKGAGLYANIGVDKLKLISLGFADQALQATAYELATVATMKQSPLMSDDSFYDTTKNVFFGALVGGGIGGALEGMFAKGLLNQAVLSADKMTKAQEALVVTKLGSGGDKAAALVNSFFDIPAADTVLGSQKLANSRTAATDKAMQMLQEFTSDDDKFLAPPIIKSIMDQIDSGSASKEIIYDHLARLNSIKNIMADPSPVDTGREFYLNNFGPKNVPDSFDDFISVAKIQPDGSFQPAVPNGKADISRRYALSPGATPDDVKIAHFDMPLTTLDGRDVPRYSSAKEAWTDGADIFINKELKVIVNPDSVNITDRLARPGESRILSQAEERTYRATGNLPPESKPLVAAPTILNVLTGDVKTAAAPVVGDLGTTKRIGAGLLYGKNQLSFQSLEKGLIDENTSTLDSSARYVWARDRGIRYGDSFESTDIPMLEQLHAEASAADATRTSTYADKLEEFSKRGVNFSDGVDFPESADELLDLIHVAKDNLAGDAINAGRNAEEVTRLANVSEDYIKNAFQTGKQEDWLPPSSSFNMDQVNHVRLDYQMGDVTHDIDGMIARGGIDVAYRLQVAKDAADSMTANYFKDQMPFAVSTKKSVDAMIDGVGPGALSFSNANYNSFGQSMEAIGRFLGRWTGNINTANMNKLTPVLRALRNNPEAATELNMFNFIRRSTNEKWVELPTNWLSEISPDLANSDGSRMVAVLKDAVQKDKQGNITGWDRNYVPNGFVEGDTQSLSPNFIGPQTKGFRTFYQLSPEVTDFERAQKEINGIRAGYRNNWYTAQGLNRAPIDPEILHAPALDTTRYPYLAYVRYPQGMGMTDDGVAVIIAKDAAGLEQKIANLGPGYETYTKTDIKTYHSIRGDYDYNRNFNESGINSDLARKGILNDMYPETNIEATIADTLNWNSRSETRLARDYVELANSQLFAEVESMGSRFANAATSRKPGSQSSLLPAVNNPYQDFIRTALNVQDKESYKLWTVANEKAEAFFSSAFNVAASAFQSAVKGEDSFQAASAASQRMGLGNVYGGTVDALATYNSIAAKMPPTNWLSKFVATTNSILQAAAIRLDTFQTLINVSSMPVLGMAELNSARGTLMKELLTTELPDGSGKVVPSITKVLFDSIPDWFNKDIREPLLVRYREIGAVRDRSSDYIDQAIEAMAFPGKTLTDSELANKLKAAVDFGAKLTGADYGETFVRFMVARSADKLYSAAGYTGTDLANNISTMVNRVHGNYVASQRPIAFQGPIGQAIGLFQTYQFNMMQQLFRYVENGDAKSLAILGGLQTSLFGLNGLPGFQAINNHIVGNAANNPGHKDAYSTVPNLIGDTLGKYLLYGSLSAVTGSGLYSRGDINPRQLTILPINPLDYPAIAGGIRFLGNLIDTGDRLAQGGDIASTLLMGFEHNSLSRPLSGLAQMVQGFTTTADGSLVSAVPNGFNDNSAGWNDVVSLANMSRLMGSRPLDEAVVMDALYRKTAYEAKDRSRIESLGGAFKADLYSTQGMVDGNTVSDFTAKYTAAGGFAPNFGAAVINWTKSTTIGKANATFQHLQLPINQQMQIIMNGQKLPDFSQRITAANQVNTGSVAVADTSTPEVQ